MSDGHALSWRQIASREAQGDLDGLLDTALGFAQQQLARHGAFFPFALAVDNGGAAQMIDPRPNDQGDHPQASRVADACLATLAETRDAIRAAALTTDVRLQSPAADDAIQVDLEHADGHALTVLLAYTKKRRGKTEYGPLTAHAGPHRIWPTPDR